MESKEEIIEDINEEVSEETITFDPVKDEAKDSNDSGHEVSNTEVYEPKKSKKPLIIFLSILLVLDITALVIYIIGIDKVLSFIK